MKRIFLLGYYLIISKLPNSWWPGGSIINRIRVYFLSKIIVIKGNARIQKNVYVGSGNNIVIGQDCQINENVRLDNVCIGNNVMIAREVVFLGKTHNSTSSVIPMSEQGFKDDFHSVVNDDVWIGLRVIILPGIVIGKGSIIGAGSVVTKNIPPYTVWGGVPAKQIKTRK